MSEAAGEEPAKDLGPIVLSSVVVRAPDEESAKKNAMKEFLEEMPPVERDRQYYIKIRGMYGDYWEAHLFPGEEPS